MRIFTNLWRDQHGTTSIEYGLMVALLAIAVIGGLHSLGDSASATLGKIVQPANEAVDRAGDAAPGDGDGAPPANNDDDRSAGDVGNPPDTGDQASQQPAAGAGNNPDRGKGKGNAGGQNGNEPNDNASDKNQAPGQSTNPSNTNAASKGGAQGNGVIVSNDPEDEPDPVAAHGNGIKGPKHKT